MVIYVVITTTGIYKDTTGFELFKTKEEALAFIKQHTQNYSEDEVDCFLYEREV
jgi:hypothetical protein